MTYCSRDGRKVIRLRDNKLIGRGVNTKHAKAIEKRFNVWHTLGWPYIPKD